MADDVTTDDLEQKKQRAERERKQRSFEGWLLACTRSNALLGNYIGEVDLGRAARDFLGERS